jgi:8-oxo-dGTP diphosphatase
MAEPIAIEVALALVWRDGRLLVTRRPAGVHLAGYWEFPGGKIGPGETPEMAAEREVREEVGIGCRARSCRAAFRHCYPERVVVLHPVDCDWLEGEPVLRGVSAAHWVAPERLTEYSFPPANAELIASLGAPTR